MKTMIQVGSLVRSFDFAGRDLTGERACYMEGVVEKIAPAKDACPCDGDHYHIRVLRCVSGGVEQKDFPEMVFPVVGGTGLEQYLMEKDLKHTPGVQLVRASFRAYPFVCSACGTKTQQYRCPHGHGPVRTREQDELDRDYLDVLEASK